MPSFQLRASQLVTATRAVKVHGSSERHLQVSFTNSSGDTYKGWAPEDVLDALPDASWAPSRSLEPRLPRHMQFSQPDSQVGLGRAGPSLASAHCNCLRVCVVISSTGRWQPSLPSIIAQPPICVLLVS